MQGVHIITSQEYLKSCKNIHMKYLYKIYIGIKPTVTL